MLQQIINSEPVYQESFGDNILQIINRGDAVHNIFVFDDKGKLWCNNCKDRHYDSILDDLEDANRNKYILKRITNPYPENIRYLINYIRKILVLDQEGIFYVNINKDWENPYPDKRFHKIETLSCGTCMLDFNGNIWYNDLFTSHFKQISEINFTNIFCNEDTIYAIDEYGNLMYCNYYRNQIFKKLPFNGDIKKIIWDGNIMLILDTNRNIWFKNNNCYGIVNYLCDFTRWAFGFSNFQQITHNNHYVDICYTNPTIYLLDDKGYLLYCDKYYDNDGHHIIIKVTNNMTFTSIRSYPTYVVAINSDNDVCIVDVNNQITPIKILTVDNKDSTFFSLLNNFQKSTIVKSAKKL